MKVEVYKTVRGRVDGTPEDIIFINAPMDAKQKAMVAKQNAMERMKRGYYSCVVRQDDGRVVCKYAKSKYSHGNFIRCYIPLRDISKELSKIASKAGIQYKNSAGNVSYLRLETKDSDFVVSQFGGLEEQNVDISDCVQELVFVESHIKELGFKGIDYLRFRKSERSLYKEVWAYSSEENPGYAVIEID